MENHQLILVIDFGGQYNHLIARRVRECGVYCEVKPYTVSIEEIKQKNPIGIIFTGGPNSVYVKDAPRIDPALYQLGIPILGICYGVQLIAQELGGHVTSPTAGNTAAPKPRAARSKACSSATSRTALSAG